MTTLAPSFPTPAQARRGVACIATAGFFLSMDITLTTLLIEPIKREMGLSDIQIGLVQGTAFGIAFGLSSVPLGRLIDKGDRVRFLGVGLLFWIAAMVTTGAASSFLTLICARLVLGCVAALLIPAAFSLIADLFPPKGRSVATSLFVVGQAAGQAFGILVGGLAFDALTAFQNAHLGAAWGLPAWRILFIGAALLGLVPYLLLARVKEPARQEQKEHHATAIGAARELWTYRRLLIPLLAAMLFTQITMQATSVWAPPVLTRQFGLTPGQFAGWLSAIMLAGGMLGALAGGRLGKAGQRQGGNRRVLMPAMTASLALIPLSLFGVLPTIPLVALFLAGNIFAGAVIATLGVIAITLNFPNEIRGLALGSNVLCSTLLGTATAPAAIAMVSKAMGGETMLGFAIAGLCAPAALLSALCFFLAMRQGTANQDGRGTTSAQRSLTEARE
ncbi:MAG: hypothetical protein CML65_00560 [Rhodobacteraceae bacterium]|nr:hypothetical protein [Erythrobacter sp.]MAY43736.1 hypothetical protein [Paracoccaceae bacterium]|tara:strand:- start:3451 stop:4791 length:1341 start_codon:yes stop_codon:yes gene_type:complete